MAFEPLTKEQWEEENFPGIEYPENLPGCGYACHRCMYSYDRANIGFSPTCELTYDLQLWKAAKSGLFDNMSQRDIDNTKIENDPVLWAHVELNWEARWYQADLLRCSSKRRVPRMGRRTGKTATLGVAALWFACNRIDAPSETSRYEVLIVTPADVQLQRIWRDITTFIDYNPRIKAKEVRRVKDPVRTLEFDNGSIIQLMVATSNVRGQDANCFVEGTLVNTSEFAVRPIEDLTLKDTVLGGDSNGFSKGKIEGLMTTDDQEIISISTALTSAQCTPDHPFFDGISDVEAKDAEEIVVSLAHQDLTFSKNVILARLAGYNFGDGWLSGNVAGFSGQEEDLEQIVEDLVYIGDKRHKVTVSFKENEELEIAGTVAEFQSTWAHRLLKEYCPSGVKVNQPLSVPDFVKNGTRYVKSAFLSGLFSAEATSIRYQKNGKTPAAIEIKMRSSNDAWLINWLEELRELFADLDIETSSVRISQISDDRYQGSFRVKNSIENIDKYIDRVGYCYNVRKRIEANKWRLYRAYLRVYHQDSWVKNRLIHSQSGSCSEISASTGIPVSTVKYHKKLADPLYTTAQKTPEELADFYSWKDHYVLLPVQKHARKYIGKATVYNLQSGASHRFMAAGMMTHNCIFVDEADYCDEEFVASLYPIVMTHPKVYLWVSSTPTGFKTKFWEYCFLEDTEIFTPGDTKKISSIQKGDSVLSCSGHIETVSETFKHEYDGSLIKLGFHKTYRTLEATAEHPHLVKQGNSHPRFVAARNIKVGDWVGVTLDKTKHEKLPYPELPTEGYRRKNLDTPSNMRSLIKEGYEGCLDRRIVKAHRNACSLVDQLNKDADLRSAFYEFLGFYIAEGNVNYNKDKDGKYINGVQTAHAVNEAAGRRVIELSRKLFPSATVKHLEEHKSANGDSRQVVIIYSREAALLCRFFGGELAPNKKIHPALLNQEETELLIAAYLIGDGHIDKHGAQSCTTISSTLADQIWRYWLSLGKSCSIYHHPKEHKHDAYTVRLLVKGTNQIKWFAGMPFVMVRSIQERNYIGCVYNFETAGTHTYSAEGFATHNCTKKDIGFKEFHFPSYVIPNYNASMEYEFRQIFTDVEYDHEVLAEFGEAEMGVFKKEHIAECLNRYSYSYKDCSYFNQKGHYRVMGIDWNDQAGVHIVICEFDEDWQAIKLVHKSIITHKDIVYHKAIERILQLQRAWKCNHIYVDKGAGKMAMEALLLEGRRKQHTRLDKIVKGVDFGGSMEVRIPGTNEFEKKKMKPLVVNMAVRRVQEVKAAFPIEERSTGVISEEGQKVQSLCTQMEEYKVERITPSGVPVYSQGEEHTLVAWMCAIFGFVMERTTILNDRNKITYDIKVAYGLSSNATRARLRAQQHANVMKEAARVSDEEMDRSQALPNPLNSILGKVYVERDSNGNVPKRLRSRASLTRRSNIPNRGRRMPRKKSGRSNI